MKQFYLNPRCTPIRATLMTLAASALFAVGCGGGGGSDDRDSIPALCRSYCSFACSKAASCGFFPASQVASCDDSCVRTIASNGGTADACDRGGRQVAAASCSQLGSILGLRSLETDAEITLKQDENSEAIAEHSGAELAVSAAE